MTGETLYLRFVLTLAIGLTGLGLVLSTLFEGLLNEWDLPRDVRLWWRRVTVLRHQGGAVRAEDILLEIELGHGEGRYQRPPTSLDQRREALRELSEAESRLPAPA